MRDYRVMLAICCLLPLVARADEGKVSVTADFPGGNIVVVHNAGSEVELAPDLRGGPNWFYWHFEAQAQQPGRVTFSFARPPMLTVRGPAVSRDAGSTWRWLAAENIAFVRKLML